MKKVLIFTIFSLMCSGMVIRAQEYSNYIACKVDGKEWRAEARRMTIPVSGFEYLALAAFQVNPDVQVWIRLYYFSDSLKPGTYSILAEDDLESQSRKKADRDLVWVMVDYTEETKGMGHAYHDGESLSGSLTIDKAGKTSIEGSFNASLKGVYYTKRAVATMTGSGIKSNLERKLLTQAGGGMLVNNGPHDHDNAKKIDKTDTISLTDGKFVMDWSKTDNSKK